MNARKLQDLLRDLLEELLIARDDADDPLADLADRTDEIRQICSFDDAGVLTTDKGLVIECDDGSEYQVTIVRSR
jgi:hypothetical protein